MSPVTAAQTQPNYQISLEAALKRKEPRFVQIITSLFCCIPSQNTPITQAVTLHNNSLEQENNRQFAEALKTAESATQILTNKLHIKAGVNPELDKIFSHAQVLSKKIEQRALAIEYHKNSLENEEIDQFGEALKWAKKALEIAIEYTTPGDDEELDEVVAHSLAIVMFAPAILEHMKNEEALLFEIESQMKNINTAEAAFQEAIKAPVDIKNRKSVEQHAAYNENVKAEWLSTFDTAFTEIKKTIAGSGVNPTQMPREAALKLSEIFTRYGITLYSNKYQAGLHPFNSSLFVFKYALLMQEYALRLSDKSPDITTIEKLKDIYKDSEVVKESSTEENKADDVMATMSPTKWAEMADKLTQHELFQFTDLLSSINGAIHYLGKTDLEKCENLLQTVQLALLKAQDNPNYDAVATKDRLAEFLYNEMTGYFAFKIDYFEKQGNTVQAETLKNVLKELWPYCVKLSKEPELMAARCSNKRTFIEKLTGQEELEMRKQAVDAYKSLPAEKRPTKLLALGLNNLAWSYENLGDLKNAFECSKEANQYAFECFTKGDTDGQLTQVMTHAMSLLIKYGEVVKQQLASLS